MKLLAAVSILLCAWAPIWSQTPKRDTIVFVGKCRYMSYLQSFNIRAADYFFFEVVSIVKGAYTDPYIFFEADASSKDEVFLEGYKRGELVNLSPDSIFYGHDFRIDGVQTCPGNEMQIEVVQYSKDFGWPEKTIIAYEKTRKPARKR